MAPVKLEVMTEALAMAAAAAAARMEDHLRLVSPVHRQPAVTEAKERAGAEVVLGVPQPVPEILGL